MQETEHLSARVPVGTKAMLREQAEGYNVTMSERLNQILHQELEPLPKPVEGTIIDLSQQLGVSINDVISFCVLNTVARTDAELTALGKPLLNCYLVQRDVSWEKIYELFREEYLGNLYRGEGGISAINRWAEARRAETMRMLKEHRKKAAKLKRAEAKAKEQATEK